MATRTRHIRTFGVMPDGSLGTARRPHFNGRKMVMVHDVFRREFALLPGLVAGVVAGDHARRQTIGDHVEALISVLNHHHRERRRVRLADAVDRLPRRGGRADRGHGRTTRTRRRATTRGEHGITHRAPHRHRRRSHGPDRCSGRIVPALEAAPQRRGKAPSCR